MDKNSQISIFEQIKTLSELMKSQPKEIEMNLVQSGEKLFAIYQDSNFTDQFRDLKDLKKSTFKMAIEDISMGAPLLSQSTIGVVFKENRLQTYINPHGHTLSGTNVFSINLKNIVAFKNYRFEDQNSVEDDHVNNGLYFLAYLLSKEEF